MSQIGNAEALERLKTLLSGEVVVEDDVFPRLVQALVRLSGRDGEELFGFHLRSTKASHMASRLSAMSVMVLGARAVPLLVDGVLATVDLARIRATTDVLAKLGTEEAHKGLTTLSQKIRHPVGKELAATKLEELERDHPTRFNLLPRLRDLAPNGTEQLLRDFLAADDREMVRLLIEELIRLDSPGKVLAYRVLASKGDMAAARALQNRLSHDFEPEILDSFCLTISALVDKLPAASEGYGDEWVAFWRKYRDRENPAKAAAHALAANSEAAHAPVYAEFLESEFVAVRLCGYKALMNLGDSRFMELAEKGISSTVIEEVGAAAAALAVMGRAEQLEELARSKSSQKRAMCAKVCLVANRRDLWGSLALDDERAVRHAAIEAMDEVSSDLRPGAEDLAPVISFTVDYDSYETLCNMLGNVGDLESATRIVARLSENDERITASSLKALKALRMRGIFRLADLSGNVSLLINTLVANIGDHGAISLIGALVEDFDIDALETIRNALLAQKASVKQGSAQNVTMAVIGRIHLLSTRKKIVDEMERAFADHPSTAREQIEAVNRVASLWLRADLELNPVFCERVEDWMISVAQDKTVARIARKSAIDAVGKGGSTRVAAQLHKLVASPTEEIANAAGVALEALSRRFPVANLGSEEHLGAPKRQGVLIVEDDTNIRNIFQSYLFQKGYSAYNAGEGEEALGILSETGVDLVLLDLHMPGMDGFKFLETLRKLRNPPPVIVITSYGDRNTVLKVLKLGAIDFLRKPVDLPEMLARVRKVIGSRPN